jgi:integrase
MFPMTQTQRIPGIRARQSAKGVTYEAWVYDRDAGKKIYASFSKLAEARSWRRDAGRAVERGELKAAPKITLQEAAEAWLEGATAGEIRSKNKRPFKPATLRAYRFALTNHVYRDLGPRKLGDIRPDDLQALLNRLTASGLSGSTVRNVLIPLQAIYRHHRRTIPVDPTNELDLPEMSPPRERAASPEEAERLLQALPEDDRALWAVAFFGGLRRGEIRALRDEDIDLEGNLIHVRHSWDDKEGEISPKSLKGVRRVPIPKALRQYLLEHRARTGRRGTDLVFGRTATIPFEPTTTRRRAIEAWTATAVGEFFQRRNARLEPIGLHEARHSYVSLMHAAGVPLERIGDYVGHSSAYMTDRYRHLIEGQHEDDAAALDGFLARLTTR